MSRTRSRTCSAARKSKRLLIVVIVPFAPITMTCSVNSRGNSPGLTQAKSAATPNCGQTATQVRLDSFGAREMLAVDDMQHFQVDRRPGSATGDGNGVVEGSMSEAVGACRAGDL